MLGWASCGAQMEQREDFGQRRSTSGTFRLRASEGTFPLVVAIDELGAIVASLRKQKKQEPTAATGIALVLPKQVLAL